MGISTCKLSKKCEVIGSVIVIKHAGLQKITKKPIVPTKPIITPGITNGDESSNYGQ